MRIPTRLVRRLLFCAALYGAGAGHAQPVIVFFQGDVMLHDGTAGSEVRIGDALEPDQVLRLGPDSLVEIDTGGDTVRLFLPGSYPVASVAGAESGGHRGLGSAVSSRLSALMGQRTPRTEVAVAGVRGEAATQSGPAVPMGGEIALLLEDARAALAAGDALLARELLEEALLFEPTGDARIEVEMALASSERHLGQLAEAYSRLESLEIPPHDPRYPQAALQLAEIAYSGSAFLNARRLAALGAEAAAGEPVEAELRLIEVSSAIRLGDADAARLVRDLLDLSTASPEIRALAERLLAALESS